MLVVLLNFNLTELEFIHEGGKAHQTLLARATDTDEHDVTSGLSERAADSQNVMHCVVEEDKVHLVGRGVIKVLQLCLKGLGELASVCNFFVDTACVDLENIAESDLGFSKDFIFLNARFEVATEHFHDFVGEPFTIIVVCETVHEDA